ncbi:MAG: glycosyltransferase [Granulosicoccus sp.]|nr:glycosyltransferase [Granulosicoccus sp.]
MNILMMTNTFTPHVGGVARSIERFSHRYRELGHHVMVIAPEFDGMPEAEPNVVRIPAVRHFNHTDFSVALPIPHRLNRAVERFRPQVVHSHHPFLVGGTAMRVAHTLKLPLVFTHHTRYEDYTHNVPGDSPLLKRFVKNLATNYANLCDQVFVPSQSIQTIIRNRGVTSPVNVVPTGVDPDAFAKGERSNTRQSLGIPDDAFVIGHLGRLTREKNLPFLIESIIACMCSAAMSRPVHCLIYGSGPLEQFVLSQFDTAGLSEYLHLPGVVDEDELADAYHAMDVFAFASTSETQGMVLTEAMASGVPVVAIDASGVREVLDDGVNGHLLPGAVVRDFADALASIAALNAAGYAQLQQGARQTAERFSMEKTASTALALYAGLLRRHLPERQDDYSVWSEAVAVVESEWELVKSTARSAIDALDTSEG